MTVKACRLWLCGLALAGGIGLEAAPAAGQNRLPQPTVAIIDYQRIIRESLAANHIREQVETRRKAYQDEIAQEEERLKNAERELAKQRSILAPEAFEARRKSFEEDVAGVQRVVQNRRRQLDEASSQAFDQVQSTVVRMLDEMSEAYAFNLVLPRRNVLLFSAELDLTVEVLEKLNEELPTVDVPEPQG